MRRFLVDAKLLPVIERAEGGEPEAQLELIKYYTNGENGAPKDNEWMTYYCYQLAKHYPKEVSLFWEKSSKMEYAKLFSVLGTINYNSRKYLEAYYWYKKAEKHCRTNYSKQGYEEEMKRYSIDKRINLAQKAIKGKLILKIKRFCFEQLFKICKNNECK